MGDEIDLRNLPFIPLHIGRLQRSKAWLACKREPALAFYMLNLWMRAWHEVPCGSIEDDDDVLADAAMCPPGVWNKVREKVLRGWESRDGRVYNPTVSEIGQSSWTSKQSQIQRTAAARQTRLQRRDAVTTGTVTGSVTENVTEDVTASNITKHNITQHKIREGKGREGVQGEPFELASPEPDAGKPAPQRAKRRTIPKDFFPSDEDIRLAEEICGESRVPEVWEQFKDHHLKMGEPMADWDAAWRTWVRNDPKFRRKSA